MIYYLCIGFGFYLALAITRKETFKNADFFSILRGLIAGLLLWPLGAFVLIAMPEVRVKIPVSEPEDESEFVRTKK